MKVDHTPKIYDQSLLGVIDKAMDVMKQLAKTTEGASGWAEVERIKIMGEGYQLGYVIWEGDYPVFVFDYEELP